LVVSQLIEIIVIERLKHCRDRLKWRVGKVDQMANEEVDQMANEEVDQMANEEVDQMANEEVEDEACAW
jgi:hypothetical protein